ncbi:MAG: ABC transporter ATP-binding protein [Cyanobacteria bacterium J06598_1]
MFPTSPSEKEPCQATQPAVQIEAQQLSGGYDDKRIIEAVNLTLHRGEWLSLVGANGSGKSTLLRLLSRILSPQVGTVLLNGRAIHTQPPIEVAKQMAILPQQQVVPAGLSVQQLVSLGRTPHQAWWQWDLTAESLEKVVQALAWTQMEAYCDRPVTELSGGEKQRAFLALALAQDPQVILLDEPTTFLDIHYQLQLLELLKQLNQKKGLSIITVLHDVNLAARYSDRIACLRQGKLWAVGEIRAMLTPKIMREVFEVNAAILETPVGLQICPIAAYETPSVQPETETAANPA